MLYFSDLLLKLQQFWKEKGCNIVMPYDIPAGAGTFHPDTLLKVYLQNHGVLLM